MAGKKVDAPLNRGLTRREREVLRLLALGAQAKEVADHLAISMSSVKEYRARLYRKLGVSNCREAARYYWQHFGDRE